jgi:sugar lactone lactonase YvrE
MIKINIKKLTFLVFTGFFFFVSQAQASVPVVATNSAGGVTASSANLNATVVSDGGASITSLGFQFGENGNFNTTVSSVIPSYQYVSQFGGYAPGMEPGGFNEPTDMAFNNTTGRLYVIEENGSSSRVQIFSANGSFISQFGGFGSGNGQFDTTGGIALDQAGNVYVTDVANNRVQKFDANGNYISQFGTWGTGNGELYYPYGITVDSSGNIYVTESQNHRVQKFDANGNYILQFGSLGSLPGQFNVPIAIDVDTSGNVYVADSQNNRIQKFTSNGQFISSFGTAGSGNGNLAYPVGIDVDEYGQIFVADMNNSRVQIFNANGTYNTQFGTANTGGLTPGEFFLTGGVVVANNGTVYVSDIQNYRIQKFTKKYTGVATPLKCGKTYQYRAFAVNQEGIGYGNVVAFNMQSCITAASRPTLTATVIRPAKPTATDAVVGSLKK